MQLIGSKKKSNRGKSLTEGLGARQIKIEEEGKIIRLFNKRNHIILYFRIKLSTYKFMNTQRDRGGREGGRERGEEIKGS